MKKILILIILFNYFLSFSQTTFGVASEYILYNPNGSSTVTLIDLNGNTVKEWNCGENTAGQVHLLEDGSILRWYDNASGSILGGGAEGGGIQIITWDNNVVWDYEWSSNEHLQHHDCVPIKKEDGKYHVAFISWDNSSVVAQNGLTGKWPTEIIEVEPLGLNGGNVVWEWHAADHVCQDDNPNDPNYYSDCNNHPELFDVSLGGSSGGPGGPGGGPGGGSSGDWIHANGLDYNYDLNQFIFSSHYFDEFYIIDRSTTTAEAATHSGGQGMGGDILYRWGHPSNYGSSGTNYINMCHGAHWIKKGYPGNENGENGILIFNNGENDGSSEIYEITPSMTGYNYNTPWNQTPSWTYSANGFYSVHLGGVKRLRNGNTLISEGTDGRIFEVNPAGQVVFDYDLPSTGGGGPFGGGSQLSKATAYPWDYPGLSNLTSSISDINPNRINIYPNPAVNYINIKSEENLPRELYIFNVLGKIVKNVTCNANTIKIDISSLETGCYFIKSLNQEFKSKFIVQ